MRSILQGFVLFSCCSCCALAQLDSSALRAKLGSPISRETFHVPPGFDLVVDYGPAMSICKLQVPAAMPSREKIVNGDEMKRRMYGFLAELVPDAMRGAELRRMSAQLGQISITSIEYQNVTIAEFQSANQTPNGNTITLTFKNDTCPQPDAP